MFLSIHIDRSPHKHPQNNPTALRGFPKTTKDLFASFSLTKVLHIRLGFEASTPNRYVSLWEKQRPRGNAMNPSFVFHRCRVGLNA
jgi:hypothetical protein